MSMTNISLPSDVRARIRTAKLPIEYEEAVKALDLCVTIDEAKYWSDASEALAAWARMTKDARAKISAKRLKLYAYRRMGELAEQIQPHNRTTGRGGSNPGPAALLIEHGLTARQAANSRAVSRVSKEKFKELIDKGVTPSKVSLLGLGKGAINSGGAYRKFMLPVSSGNALAFRSFCRANPPIMLAKQIRIDEAKKCKEVVLEIQEWLDTFEGALPR